MGVEMMPDFANHRREIERLRTNLQTRKAEYDWARANDKVAVGMARDNLSGARDSLRDAIAEARHGFDMWVVQSPY